MRWPGFAKRHPVWFVTLLELAVIVVYGLTGTIAHFAELPGEFVSIVANVMLIVLAAGLLTRLGWWRTAGFRLPVRPRDLLWFVPLLLPIGFSLAAGTEFKGWVLTSQLLISALLIGFAEEAFFRGLMLSALKTRGFWTAAVVSSVLFGLSHTLNLLSGKSGAEILIQVSYALAIGFCFAATVLRTGLIWPLVLIHALIDFTSFLGKEGTSPAWNAPAGIGVTFAFMSYGLYLMLHRQSPGVKVAAA
ncbi:CPBP family intramembrane metalloprotease [Deinococcus psychrotolerans]|uniref:CPBP family intramembrane metalloprotease n=1 Tax=Deinococcus psychrotolerans TaxID=2489213 RepID=A0A3G8YHB1_9DEIO|nr:CPBP family intramembrane glutamic endopeptidase [Deinococcus psychrotolerans]AZI44230.1 CPBP family intramembrane metalloprotease [Deinococcus psychrotolerans]